MDKKNLGLWGFGIVLLFLVLVIGVPLGINACYQCDTTIITTQWGAESVLSYYGTVLAATGAAIGIYFSIKAAHKNYQEDVRMRVLPFIAVTPFSRRARVNPLALLEGADKSTDEIQAGDGAGEYVEYKLEQVYFIITSNGIEIKNKLDNCQKKILERAGTV